jgi:hypothetical protein
MAGVRFPTGRAARSSGSSGPTLSATNQLVRAHPAARGEVARRARTYRAVGDRRTIALGVGDEVILRRNHRLTRPDGTRTAVRNGMTGRVTATRRRHVTVHLDRGHTRSEDPRV